MLPLLKIALGGALGGLLFVGFFQERVIFLPRPVEMRPEKGPNLEEVTLSTPDGVKLRGWFIKGAAHPRSLVIYFGGTAEEVSWLAGVADRFAGWSLLLVNYRGYGDSEGSPGEKELYADALLAFDYASGRPDIDPERIVAMGRSLGSGVAVSLASKRRLRSVILVSPYDSIEKVAQRLYPYLPVSLLLRHHFDSLALTPQVEVPMLCLVATDDRLIPVEHSRALFDAWRGAKTWREVPNADHDSINEQPEYWSVIEAYLRGQT